MAASGFDENALSGAFFGGVEHGVDAVRGDVDHRSRPALHLRSGRILHVRDSRLQSEHFRTQLFTESIARAEILIYPHLHLSLRYFRLGSGLSIGKSWSG